LYNRSDDSQSQGILQSILDRNGYNWNTHVRDFYSDSGIIFQDPNQGVNGDGGLGQIGHNEMRQE
jgi:hypothetical protein